MMKRLCLSLVMLFTFILSAHAQNQPVLQTDEAQASWREDVQYMAEQMKAIHPNLFWRISEADFDGAIAHLEARLPYLTEEQIKVELVRIAALIDGHTVISLFQPALNFHIYPIRLYYFSDGLYVVDAESTYQEAIGKKLVRIGKTDVEAVFQQIAPLSHDDNQYMDKLVTAFYMTIPESLHALGIVTDVNQPEIVLSGDDGVTLTINPTPLTLDEYLNWGNGQFVTLPPQPETLYLSQQYEEAFWFTFLEDSKTLYVQYNAVQSSTQSGETMSAFAKRIEDFVDTTPIERAVIDLRHNTGGDNHFYPPLLRLLTENLNQAGKLFVIIGRMTLSAAVNFATEVEQKTDAIFVGEPTGAPPNLYADARSIRLPNSGLEVNVSARYVQKSTADDTRLWLEPDIPVELSSSDFFSGRDPALETILTYHS